MNRLERMAGAVREAVAAGPLVTCSGIVTEVTPSSYRISGLSPFVRLGDTVSFETDGMARTGEIVRVQRMGATVKPFGPQVEARLGLPVRKGGPLTFSPDPSWKGRVVNALCAPVDGLGPLRPGSSAVPADAEPPAALRRSRVKGSLKTGVRAIDIFCPICPGQRIGIFAGSGVGKSTLLAMLAAARGFDTVVIALVGERGREVREFIEDALGDNRSRAVTVVATGDESPMMRRLAPKTAMCIAEMFRDRGEQVLLIVDSVTRFAHAARDVALAAGEPAVARGYAPSVFSDLPKLLERSGPGLEGSGNITGIFSVLVDGDDHNDPVADTIRGTLDGHIVLDRKIAAQGRYPAVDLQVSLSRLAHQVWTPEQRVLVSKLREMITRFEDTRDLRHGGLQGRQRPGSRPGRDAGASDLRVHGAVTRHARERGRLPRSRHHVAETQMRPAMSSRFAKGASKLAIVRASGDWVLGGLGVGAATASASFAAYMLAFGPSELVPGGDFTIFASYDHRPRVAQPTAGPTHGNPAPGQLAEGSPAGADTASVDFTPTGSIAPAVGGAVAPSVARPSEQDGKSLPAFNLRDVFDGQALVESRSSISVVKPGSMLDGAGEVLSIEKRGEHWVVLTASGIIAQRR